MYIFLFVHGQMQASQPHSFAAANPRAIFSVRKAVPSYDGPLFLLRKIFDNSVTRVVDENGTLKTEDGHFLRDILKHTAHMVDTWYDQSGNNNHAIQTDKFVQPYLALKEEGGFVVDFKYGRYLIIPKGTVPSACEPFSVVFKHGDITNPNGGVLGSGLYGCNSTANAIRRSGDRYVNYFWSNDLYTEHGSYQKGNVVSFVFSANHRHTSAVNGIVSSVRGGVSRFGAPESNTIGKAYGENEYLNGELEFLYITDEVSKSWVSLETGEWKETKI